MVQERTVLYENNEIHYLLEQKPVKNLNLRVHKDCKVYVSANSDIPTEKVDDFVVSKGAYIRTLCHDIGEKLGCGAAMETLLRTKVGRFTLDGAITLAEAEAAMQSGEIGNKIFGIEEILAEYPRVCCTKEGDRLLANGNPLVQALVDAEEKDGWVRMCNSEGNFVGVYQWDEKRDRYFPVKMF